MVFESVGVLLRLNLFQEWIVKSIFNRGGVAIHTSFSILVRPTCRYAVALRNALPSLQLRLLVKRTMIDKDHGSVRGYLLVLCCLLGNFLPGFPLP